MLLLFISLYLLSNIAVGIWAARRVTTSQDFVLAGRRLPLVLAASVTFATWFGSETIMGAPAMFVEGGIPAVIEEPFGSALCLFLVGAFFARPLYRLPITTFCDYFRIRFGRAAELLSAVMTIPSYFGWIAAQFIAIGIVLNVVTGVSREYCILFSATVVMIYTLLGGMWSISITDFFHNLIIIVALIVLAVLLWKEVGGWEPIYQQTPKGFFRFLPQATFKDWVVYIGAWMTIGLGSIPQQDIFQRVMAAKTENTSVRASYLASGMYLTVAMLPLFIALSARILHPNLGKDNQLIIPNMVMQYGGLPLQVLFFGAVTSAILSVSSGAILAPAAVFGENVVKFFVPDLSDRDLLKTIRWAVVVITLCSVWMSTARSTNIFELVGESSAFSLVSLFVPLTAGIYWKRANLTGCLWSMSLGLVSWLLCLWLNTSYPPMMIGLMVSTVAMVAGSLLVKRYR
ncbi:sodium:solute symporter family protein [Spirosoma utsteinense]|uniref:SSS family transporter n=1 Tax=Spirosoma utsteinense TaxID=2585773 RepID=A0ABR6W0M8_9BACT|nr:sodium:solute symporter family protein [Spirosoma utsteinense]MBC3783761.1 SSS family transporter [Spirosoma utsteinense]MBC3790095.1 SSS family transporter [Spirosoma utsteinense]